MHLLVLLNGLWELAFEFLPVINAKIQACIKTIDKHAKKLYLA